jgi:uncharacterized protein (DUF58 family)
VSTPLQGKAMIGPLSTNFKEIRQYIPGDPYKLINWKATARMSTGIENFPFLNEYEREGKICAWIFLDAHPNMCFGTSIENAFEYCVEASINLSHLFLNRGFVLGMYVYNNLKEKFYPDAGKHQFIKIANRLLTLYSVEKGIQFHTIEGLPEAIEANRTLLTSFSPLIVIVTHLTQDNVEEIIQSIKKVSTYTMKKFLKRIIILNVIPYDLVNKRNKLEELTAQILEAKSKQISYSLRMLGVIVLDWNPIKENFGEVLAKNFRLLLSK